MKTTEGERRIADWIYMNMHKIKQQLAELEDMNKQQNCTLYIEMLHRYRAIALMAMEAGKELNKPPNRSTRSKMKKDLTPDLLGD